MNSCLYCGKRLGWVCDTAYVVDSTKPPRVCGSRRSDYSEGSQQLFHCKSTKFKKIDGGWMCADPNCRSEHEGRRQVTSRAHRYTKPGPNGDGFFCSKTCGWKFGIRAADAGYRLKAK